MVCHTLADNGTPSADQIMFRSNQRRLFLAFTGMWRWVSAADDNRVHAAVKYDRGMQISSVAVA